MSYPARTQDQLDGICQAGLGNVFFSRKWQRSDSRRTP